MSGRVAILATMPPADTARVNMMFDYASAAAAMGLGVMIFFSLDSVLIVKSGVYEKLSRLTREKISKAMALGVRMVACSAAKDGYGVEKFSLGGVEVKGAGSFFDYASSAKVTLTL